MNIRNFYILIVTVLVAGCSNPDRQAKQNDTAPLKNTAPKKTILFFGNSLTAGYGLDDPSTEAFPAIIQQMIDSLHLAYSVVNAGLSGETTSAGNERIDWLLKQKIDVFVLELGANDGLRGISTNETYKNLTSIVDKVRKTWPDCKLVLTGMLVPPNMGADYAGKFKEIFPKLAKEKHMSLVPFLLDHVAGISTLNQNDGIHPTAEGHRIVAKNVWTTLKTIL